MALSSRIATAVDVPAFLPAFQQLVEATAALRRTSKSLNARAEWLGSASHRRTPSL
jgi:L-amino acid N-acyltransferase YncA